MRLWAAARVRAVRHQPHPTTVAGEPATYTPEAGRVNPYCLKDLNDRYGHNAGDAALRAVGRTLGEVLRRADVAARVGGDEFVVLALGLEESDRQLIAQRIQADLCVPDTATGGRRVAVSLGWAGRTPRESKLVEDLLREADSAMYQTKASKGKSRGRAPTVQ